MRAHTHCCVQCEARDESVNATHCWCLRDNMTQTKQSVTVSDQGFSEVGQIKWIRAVSDKHPNTIRCFLGADPNQNKLEAILFLSTSGFARSEHRVNTGPLVPNSDYLERPLREHEHTGLTD